MICTSQERLPSGQSVSRYQTQKVTRSSHHSYPLLQVRLPSEGHRFRPSTQSTPGLTISAPCTCQPTAGQRQGALQRPAPIEINCDAILSRAPRDPRPSHYLVQHMASQLLEANPIGHAFGGSCLRFPNLLFNLLDSSF
jgi:hypothetical protein